MLKNKKTANGVKAWQARDEKAHIKSFVDFHKGLSNSCFCADADVVEGRFLFGQFGICAIYEVTTLRNLDYPNLVTTCDMFRRMRKFQLPMYYLLGKITGLPTYVLTSNRDATKFCRLDVMADEPIWHPMTKEEVKEWIESMVPRHNIDVPAWIKNAGKTRESCQEICAELIQAKLCNQKWQEQPRPRRRNKKGKS